MANTITSERNPAGHADGTIAGVVSLPAPATSIRQTVGVDDIRVEAFIGVHGHEKNRRQLLVVAVELEITAPVHDTIADTIDYNRIADACRELADRGIGLIETFARQLGQELLGDRRVLRAEVSITKPGALPNGVARATATLIRPPSQS
ncbi:dihydroneopterin aldolase [Novosphingobium sp. CF614]|uniref:dihydroneopterin aldolase n=1 Tax=Novosphingobium sp. CF614 TaxID=1884364 RepID=UPI0008EADA15|nr:dihydroneopterin aldolase [Novosphingobium sp. CF614]SFG45826.1 dihydroneopterin aldolase [Novosphingobium sp. CF614]